MAKKWMLDSCFIVFRALGSKQKIHQNQSQKSVESQYIFMSAVSSGMVEKRGKSRNDPCNIEKIVGLEEKDAFVQKPSWRYDRGSRQIAGDHGRYQWIYVDRGNGLVCVDWCSRALELLDILSTMAAILARACVHGWNDGFRGWV